MSDRDCCSLQTKLAPFLLLATKQYDTLTVATATTLPPECNYVPSRQYFDCRLIGLYKSAVQHAAWSLFETRELVGL